MGHDRDQRQDHVGSDERGRTEVCAAPAPSDSAGMAALLLASDTVQQAGEELVPNAAIRPAMTRTGARRPGYVADLVGDEVRQDVDRRADPEHDERRPGDKPERRR